MLVGRKVGRKEGLDLHFLNLLKCVQKVGAAIKWIWGISWLCRDHSSHENVGSPSDDTGSVILEKNKILMTEFRYVSCHVIVLISWSKWGTKTYVFVL